MIASLAFIVLRMGKWFCLIGMSLHPRNRRGKYSHRLNYYGLAWLFPLMNEITHWEIFCFFLIIVFSLSLDLSEFRLHFKYIFCVLKTQKHQNMQHWKRKQQKKVNWKDVQWLECQPHSWSSSREKADWKWETIVAFQKDSN